MGSHNMLTDQAVVSWPGVGEQPSLLNFALLENCWKLLFLSENSHLKMQNLGLKTPNLCQKFSAVCWNLGGELKLPTPTTFLNPRCH